MSFITDFGKAFKRNAIIASTASDREYATFEIYHNIIIQIVATRDIVNKVVVGEFVVVTIITVTPFEGITVKILQQPSLEEVLAALPN